MENARKALKNRDPRSQSGLTINVIILELTTFVEVTLRENIMPPAKLTHFNCFFFCFQPRSLQFIENVVCVLRIEVKMVSVAHGN